MLPFQFISYSSLGPPERPRALADKGERARWCYTASECRLVERGMSGRRLPEAWRAKCEVDLDRKRAAYEQAKALAVAEIIGEPSD